MKRRSAEGHEREIARVFASRRWRAVLFTDIVDSTRQWNERGDVVGRLRLEEHDRLLHPIVGLYHGWLVKTIGDSLLACFEDADNAVRAAIAMQQALAGAAEKDAAFDLRVRIGVHGGKLVVEKDDVYGDPVNVASRVVDEAEGGTIVISEAIYQRLDRSRYHTDRLGSFTPRGKRSSILLYRVSWWRIESRLAPCAPPEPQREPQRGAAPPKPRRPPRAPLRFRWGGAVAAHLVALALVLRALELGPVAMAARFATALDALAVPLRAAGSALADFPPLGEVAAAMAARFGALAAGIEARPALPGGAGIALLSLLSLLPLLPLLPFGLRRLRGLWAGVARFVAGALGLRLLLLSLAPQPFFQHGFLAGIAGEMAGEIAGGIAGTALALSRIDLISLAFGLSLAAWPRLRWLAARPPRPAPAEQAPAN